MAQQIKRAGVTQKPDAIEVPGLKVLLPKEASPETVDAATMLGRVQLAEEERSRLGWEEKLAKARARGRIEARAGKKPVRQLPKSELSKLEAGVAEFLGSRRLKLTLGTEDYFLSRDSSDETKIEVQKKGRYGNPVTNIDEVAKVIRAAAKAIEAEKEKAKKHPK